MTAGSRRIHPRDILLLQQSAIDARSRPGNLDGIYDLLVIRDGADAADDRVAITVRRHRRKCREQKSFANAARDAYLHRGGKPVPDGFSYSSDTNPEKLDSRGLQALLAMSYA